MNEKSLREKREQGEKYEQKKQKKILEYDLSDCFRCMSVTLACIVRMELIL